MLDQKKNIAFIKTNLIPKLPNSMNRLEDISLNVGFREKGANLDRKELKKIGTRFSPELSLG